MVNQINPTYKTSFVSHNEEEQAMFNRLLKIMVAAKQQIVLRRALHGTK